jgi:hypothetical protein
MWSFVIDRIIEVFRDLQKLFRKASSHPQCKVRVSWAVMELVFCCVADMHTDQVNPYVVAQDFVYTSQVGMKRPCQALNCGMR